MGLNDLSRGERLAAAGVLGWVGWKAVQKLRERSLAGHVVLVTGGSRGLGLLLAREFVREGCRVAICARDPQELDAARRDLEARGGRVLPIVCDVGDREQAEAMVARVTEHFGRVDVLVNNATVIQVGPLASMTVEDFHEAMDVNFWGSVHTTLAVVPQMRARGTGRIVNVTSIGGKVALPHMLPYDCAKFAAVALSEGLRSELAKDGITVTTVVPGLMRTGSPVNAWFKGDTEREFDWFSVSAATPLTTMSAARAARRIVLAAKRGEAEVTLTWQATVLRMVHGIFPGATADAAGVVNRLLPGARPDQRGRRRGMEMATPTVPSAVTGLMNRAARETHQYAGTPEPSPRHARQAGLNQEER
jgi:NAD(P)-dependent dehydrogenase (short-subunit alcohol dehydrogenase family)